MPGENSNQNKKSFTADEVQAVVDRLSNYDNTRWPAESRTKDDLHSNNFELLGKIQIPSKDAPLKKQAEEIVERLSQYDRAKLPAESPYLKDNTKRERAPNEVNVDVKEVVERLSRYDKSKYPPDSKGSRHSMIPPIIQPRWNPGSGKQCSDDEIKEIVDRLSKYDPEKGPPGSPYKKVKG